MELPGAAARSSSVGPAPNGVDGIPEAACWVCSRRVARFEPYGVPPRIGRCPHCGAKPRSRALHRLVRDRIGPRLAAGDRVLEIGPSRFSADHIIGGSLFAPARCVAVDVRQRRHHRRLGASGRFATASAAMLPLADATFDFILCNNTLPYVREDRRALAEIARCLKRKGLAMIDTHRGPGATRTGGRAPPRAPRARRGVVRRQRRRLGLRGKTSSTGCGRRGSNRWRWSCFRAHRTASSPKTD